MATSGISVEDSLILTRWAGKWLKYAYNVVIGNSPVEATGKQLLSAFDALEDEPADLVEVHEVTLEKTVTTTKTGTTTVLKNEKRSHKLR
jgi:hypothetical protein